jgi:hypothetical protein
MSWRWYSLVFTGTAIVEVNDVALHEHVAWPLQGRIHPQTHQVQASDITREVASRDDRGHQQAG